MNNILNRLYFSALCSMLLFNVTARDTDSLIFQSQSVRSVGMGFPALNYDLLSQLNHTGYSICFASTRFRDKPAHLTLIDTHFRLGILYNAANDSYITMLGFSASLTRYLYSTDASRSLRIMLGAVAQTGIDVFMKDENINNPVAYFFNISLNPSLLTTYRFNIRGSKFEIGQQFYVPLLSIVSTSDYSSSLPYGFIENDANFFDAMRFASFGSLVKFTTATIFDVNTSFQQREKLPVLRITYQFAGLNYNYNDISVKSAEHSLVFGAIFYLFK